MGKWNEDLGLQRLDCTFGPTGFGDFEAFAPILRNRNGYKILGTYKHAWFIGP